MLIYPLINDTTRKIIHIDMDAFFASVEERDNPRLRGKPVVVARNPLETGGRGVVSTANYLARQYGIHSAMSAKEAYERCPQAVFVSGDYPKYKRISNQIHAIFHRYTDLVEGVAFDEAYLDVTQNKIQSSSAIKIAKYIQQDIWRELGLTSSAGVSYNKFLAKLASDYEKPKGLTVILPEEAQDFLDKLPIESFHGVGQKTAEKLQHMGFSVGRDIRRADPQKLADQLGKQGWLLFLKAHGIHDTPVVADRERQSIGSERTYKKRLEAADLQVELAKLANKTADLLDKHGMTGRTVTLKIRFYDFKTITKRVTGSSDLLTSDQILQAALRLLEKIDYEDKGVRLLGISLSTLKRHKK